jgi:uroporphyrin-III C-methyltransferase
MINSGGKVWLVGAGPGDPELLTLKAVRVLAQADVVLHDDLVQRAVLAHVRPEARIVAVGKRGGCKSTAQDFIERLMIAEAKRGRRVVRLKGGDPFVFGRGGEECAALRAAGIAVEIVNGVSAGMMAAASLGAALTHRDVCHGVVFVTGHTHAGGGPDWAALARTGMTLVIYMGVANCRSIQQALLAGGLPPCTPAAVVQDASLPRERKLMTTLDQLPRDLAAAGLGSPSVIVIGDVLAYADAALLAAPPMKTAGTGH